MQFSLVEINTNIFKVKAVKKHSLTLKCYKYLKHRLLYCNNLQYEGWLRSTQTDTLQFNGAISAINTARNNMAWGTSNADMILKATRSEASTLLLSTTLVFALVVLCIRI